MALIFALSGCVVADSEGSLDKIELAWEAAAQDNAVLQDTLERLYKDCMEDKGFHAHPATLGAWENSRYAEQRFDAYLDRMFPPSETAEKVGMGASPEESILDRINNPEDDEMPIDVVGDDARTDYGRLSYGGRSRYNQALEGYLYSEADNAESSGNTVLPNHEVIVIEGGMEIQYPTKGCKAEIHTQIFGDSDGIENYYHLKGYVIDLWPRFVMNEVESNSNYQSAEADWAACLEDGGLGTFESLRYIVPAVDSIWQSAYSGHISEEEWDKLKEEEVRLVLAHLDCASDSDLRSTMETIYSEASERFLLDHEVQFFNWNELIEESLTRAQDLL